MSEKPSSLKKISYVIDTDFHSQRGHEYIRSISKVFTPQGLSLTGPLLQGFSPSGQSRLNLLASRQCTASYQRSKFQLDATSSTDFSQPYMFEQTPQGEAFTLILPPTLASLLNESKLWGCYYILPQLYQDVASPTVRIRTAEELNISPDERTLSRDLISTCLSYLSRSPITGSYVYTKLDLSDKNLQDISVLEHYKFIQYLDLSKNFLADIQVLSHLIYLQYLSVNFNSLLDVLEYETPQRFLTEVHYKYNYVKKIKDLSQFWSITVLDLSQNNIKYISGLHNLRYLRKLDLSFNHIKRLENLNNLRITWLDISYNDISSFEWGPHVGLKTLLHLEFLNINDNKITTLNIFSGCSRIRELYCRNNGISNILEVAVYLRKLRNLNILDLRGNSICSENAYKAVIALTFPNLLTLDDVEVDPVEQVTKNMQMNPQAFSHASRRLLRLMYVEQLSRARVSQHLPPADTTDVPIVVIVGPEASGKGSLCRRLAAECSSHVKHARLHTTATYHTPGHYHLVTHEQMDEMLVSGELLTYNEMFGESYGLSRVEAAAGGGGRVVVTHTDQLQALMLRLRHCRPYLILASRSRVMLERLQAERKAARQPKDMPKASTLQVVVSGRIDVTGILQEIIMSLPENKTRTAFEVASSCSLSVDNEQLLDDPDSTATVEKEEFQRHGSMKSLYNEQLEKGLAATFYDPSEKSESKEEQRSKMSTGTPKILQSLSSRPSSRPKSFDTGKQTTSRSFKNDRATLPESSKSVAFRCEDTETHEGEANLSRITGLIVKETSQDITEDFLIKSASEKYPAWLHERLEREPEPSIGSSEDDRDMWCSFMHDMGLLEKRDETGPTSTALLLRENSKFKWVEPHDLQDLGGAYTPIFRDTGSRVKDDYESLHRKYPGVYWDTMKTDDPDEAYTKLKRMVKELVNCQRRLRPMFDIDFRRSDAAVVRTRRQRFLKQISSNGIFL